MTATLTIDAAGRIVIPIEVRRQFGLTVGAHMHLLLEADGIRLVPVVGAGVQESNGLLLLSPAIDATKLQMRDIPKATALQEQRVRRLAGVDSE